MRVRWNELRIILWLRRVGTVSSCPRVTVEKGEMCSAHGEVFIDKPMNPRGHKKRAHPT